MPRKGDSPLERLAWTGYALVNAPLQRRAPFRSPAATERAQRRNVRRAVAHAHRHVPYYRETMRRLGLGPGDIVAASDLAKLPVIERDQLRSDPEYFVSDARPLEEYIRLGSDGTTGEPVRVYHDPFALFRGATHNERREGIVFRLARRRLRLKRVIISQATGTLATTTSAFRRRSLVPARVRYVDTLLPMYAPVEETARRIDELAPDLVRGYGSYLEAIVLHVERTGMPFRTPRVFTYGADSIHEPVREILARRGAEVLSGYGSVEAHHIAFECDHHTGLHLNEDLYPVRIIDANGEEVPEGEPGDVVISNLVNRATVLLNYRIGDRARRLPGRCPCGRTLPRISHPEGRIDDWVEAPGGEQVHAQEVRGLVLGVIPPDVLAFQIEQHDLTRFSVRAVPAEGADREELRRRVIRRFAERFGDDTVTEVDIVADLARTPGGKVRVVTSRVTG